MNSKLEDIKLVLSKDKRKSDRLLLPLQISYAFPHKQKWIGPFTIDDIGGGGVRFKSKRKLKKNTEISLKIELPESDKPIICKGQVIWCKKISPPQLKECRENELIYLIGIKFHKMNFYDRRRYINYICKNILIHYLNDEGKLKL